MRRQLPGHRDIVRRKRRGMMLAELLIGSCLLLMAGALVLESTSMLVKLNTAAEEHRRSAYALTALVEEVSLQKGLSLPREVAGWRAEGEPGMSGPYMSSQTVSVTGRLGRRPVSIRWESWR